MNSKKICFIICVNDNAYEEECLKYIRTLNVPAGFEIEQLSVRGAASMTSGYNEAMRASDAKYKIYIHQDVFLINKNIINDLLKIFEDDSIGLVGLVGSIKLPESAIMWDGERIGRAAICSINATGDCLFEKNPCVGVIRDVEAVDGLFIATQYDVEWQEDIFDGWDFYDVSQCYEFRNKGYRTVVPDMDKPWVLHDDGVLNLKSYFKYRDIFLKKYYGKESYGNEIAGYAESVCKANEAIIQMNDILANKGDDRYITLANMFTPDFCNEYVAKSTELLSLYTILHVYAENVFQDKEEYLGTCLSVAEIIKKWQELKMLMWEAEKQLDENAESRFYRFIVDNKVSDVLLKKMIDFSAVNSKEMKMLMACVFADNGDVERAKSYI